MIARVDPLLATRRDETRRLDDASGETAREISSRRFEAPGCHQFSDLPQMHRMLGRRADVPAFGGFRLHGKNVCLAHVPHVNKRPLQVKDTENFPLTTSTNT